MTADTFSDTLGFSIMGTGNDNNTWGTIANNSVFQIFEDAIANALTSTVTGGTLDLSGSPPPAAASQVRYAALIFNGTLGSNQTVQVPNLQKFWCVKNATSGAFTLKIKTPSGTASTAIPQNSGWQRIYCDGADNIVVSPFNTAQVQMPDGSVSSPAYSNLNEPTSGWYRAGDNDWRFSVAGSDILRVIASGLEVNGGAVLSDGDTVLAADGSVSAPGYAFDSEAVTGLYRIGLGDFAMAVLQSKRAEITSTAFSWLGNTIAGSDLAPSSISSNQNNYNPAGLGLVLTLGSITAGSGYVDGSYANVALTGGTGSGAKANVTVSGSAVTAVTLTSRGTGYVASDSLSAANTSLGGTGSGFAVPVATVDALTGTGLRLNVTAACSMTGLAGGAAGREIVIINVGTATLQCPANSASSSAANRFANAFNIAPGQAAALRYDGTSSLWRLKGTATAASSCAIGAVSPDLLIVNDGVSPNTKRNITCSEVVLTDTTGNAIKFENVSVSIDYTTTGANGCDVGTRAPSTAYFEWLISDGINIAGLASTSSTYGGLTLPANYIYAKRVGANFTDGSSNLNQVRQSWRHAQYVVGSNPSVLPTIATGTTGSYGSTTATLAAVSLGNIVPTTATRINVVANTSYTAGTSVVSPILVAPNTNWGGSSRGPGGNAGQNYPIWSIAASGGGSAMSMSADLALESHSIAIAMFSSGAVACLGWTDSI